jgi:hypothetical protein
MVIHAENNNHMLVVTQLLRFVIHSTSGFWHAREKRNRFNTRWQQN